MQHEEELLLFLRLVIALMSHTKALDWGNKWVIDKLRRMLSAQTVPRMESFWYGWQDTGSWGVQLCPPQHCIVERYHGATMKLPNVSHGLAEAGTHFHYSPEQPAFAIERLLALWSPQICLVAVFPGARRLHYMPDYKGSLSKLMDLYNDERPRLPYLMWMVRPQVQPCDRLP